MPYWLQSTLIATPAFLWVYLLLGVLLALALLPRADWHDRPLVLMTAFALGPGALTALMFVLGSFAQPWLTRGNVLIGLVLLTIAAGTATRIKHQRTQPVVSPARAPLTPIEIALLVMIAAALVIRWVVVAYWPFTAYDALWVYGYEGRLYLLRNLIPAEIGYYPQFLPLQFTFGQLVLGQVDDHAARAVLPLLHIGSILAAYTLGNRLFNRRTGVYLAALWALYPAVGAWARMGDLEIPLAFLVTATAVFFFMAWHGERPRQYAVLAGIVYGLALWTKPTAGAFALGVILLNGVELVRLRFDWRAYRPRFEVSAITALACVPLGGAWYVRNLLLGHNAVDFPPRYWHTLAERGGGQLLWYMAGLALLLMLIYARRGTKPPSLPTLAGFALILVGAVPSATARYWDVAPGSPLLVLFPSLDGLPRLGAFEWVLLLLGSGLVAWGLLRYAAQHAQGTNQALLGRVGWALTLTVPYFIVFFWLYSYHYRLAFAIVPLMALPIAVMLAYCLPPARLPLRSIVAGVALLVAVPGVVAPLYDAFLGWGYLWRSELATDVAKLTSGNDALMWMVDGFQQYEREQGEPPVISAPGVQRLPFFFPLADVRIHNPPSQLHELNGVTYFVDSHPDGTGAYERAGVPPLENQVLSALGRQDILRRAWWRDDGIFRYEIYELNLDARFTPKQPLAATESDIVFGGFARLLGHEISSSTFQVGQRRTVKLFWQVIEPADGDYMTYIHLRDADDTLQMAWDGPVAPQENGRYYTTQVWEPGEYIVDERLLQLTNYDTPPGEDYSIVVGLYDLTTGERVGVTRNGELIGDGYRLGEALTVTPVADD